MTTESVPLAMRALIKSSSRMSRYFWVIFVCWTLCLVPIGHASTAKNTKMVDPCPPIQQQPKQPQQQQHHHIRLTGYGSRSARKSIFVDEPVPTSPIQPKLWVQKAPDAVWFHSAARSSKEDEEEQQQHNSKRNVTSVCVRMVGNQWILETKEKEKDENAVVASQTTDDTTTTTTARQTTKRKRKRLKQEEEEEGWIPVEGLYGMYQMPSGIVIAIVTNSDEVLTLEPWGQIRRVRSIELIYLPHDNAALSQRQLHEEARQVRLLRQALKTHDFYYIPQPPPPTVVVESDTPKTPSKNKNLKKKKKKKKAKTEEKNRYVVRDMTQTLQRAMTTMTDSRKNNKSQPFSTVSSSTEWWESNPPDARFFWNQPAVEPLLDRHKHESQQQQQQQEQENNNTTTTTTTFATATTTLLRHVIPVTSAFVGVQTNVGLDNITVYDEILISRRSRFRAGTRFTKRGADASGAVANYAETEQILLLRHNHSLVASHVQIRGSIPLRWSSPADVKTYRPRVRIGTDPLAQARAMRNHLSSEWPRYIQSSSSSSTARSTPTTTTMSKTTQQQVKTKAANEPTDKAKLIFINLIDKKKDQGRLGRAFDSVLQAVLEVQANATATTMTNKKEGGAVSLGLSPSTVEHVWFDFHAEVKHGKWDKLSTLLGRVMSSMDQHGYFCAAYSKKKGWKPTKLQNGVVRTNCMDCLDRTNVVQSIFGRYMLFQQLSNTPPVQILPKKAKKSAVESTTRQKTVTTRKTIPNKSVVAGKDAASVGGFKMPLSFKVAFRRHASYLSLPWSHGEKSHRLLWADNADAISKLYAGTPALKGDFTRTGKRTRKGALDDGMNSLQRYYLNNFMDADRQEGMDLMVGYADFTVIDEDDDEVDYEEHEAGAHHDSGTAWSESHPAADTAEARAMRLARSMMLERQGMETDVEDTGLLTTRTTTSRSRRWNRRIVSSPIGSPLEMRWIPGDLQSHVKDVASSMTNFTDALQAMDRRSLSFLPWWVVDDSDSDSELSDQNDNDDAVAVDGLNVAASVNAGHILGGLIAAIQAPLATAASVVLLLGLPVLNH